MGIKSELKDTIDEIKTDADVRHGVLQLLAAVTRVVLRRITGRDKPKQLPPADRG